jgi:hypothetical protein
MESLAIFEKYTTIFVVWLQPLVALILMVTPHNRPQPFPRFANIAYLSAHKTDF